VTGGGVRAESVETLADELPASSDVWLTLRDAAEAAASARLQAADRVVERILGRIGEKLFVQHGAVVTRTRDVVHFAR
jgi:hypothetical protein